MESAFFWRKSSRHAFIRAVPLAMFAALFSAAMLAGSILSSLATNATGGERLIVSSDCGFFAYDNSSSLPVRTKAMTARDLNQTIAASAYARQCYEGNAKLNSLACSTYMKPALSYKVVANASCPFEESMCLDNHVYQLDTGLIDTHKDLGINSPKSQRVGFRKVSTCAIVTQEGFRTNSTASGLAREGDNVVEFHYGGSSISLLSNTTYFYNTHALEDGFGYDLESITASPGAAAGWMPIDELAQKNADLSLIFLAPNGIMYYEANNDPFFSANDANDAGSTDSIDASYYKSDNVVNIMGCTDQYQYCHPEDLTRCTPLTDYANAWTSIYDPKLGFDDVQQLVASRIALNSRGLSIHHSISGRGASALRAQDYVAERSQLQVLPNQWQIEINTWFDIALAKIQRAIVEYATGPEFTPEGTYNQKPSDTDFISRAMCKSQIIRRTDGSTSFSVLAISLMFGIGAVIMFIWLVLEAIVSFFQKKMNWGDYRRIRWVMDDKLQVQRMAFEGAGMGGEWQNLSGTVPYTAGNPEFAGLEHVDPEKPRWHQRQSWQNPHASVMAQKAPEDSGSVSSLDHHSQVMKFDPPPQQQQVYEQQHQPGYQQVQQQEQQWPFEDQMPQVHPPSPPPQMSPQPAAYERQTYQPASTQG